METINYLTDAEGRKKAVVIDTDELKHSGQVGNYRILYTVDDDTVMVEVVKVGN